MDRAADYGSAGWGFDSLAAREKTRASGEPGAVQSDGLMADAMAIWLVTRQQPATSAELAELAADSFGELAKANG